MSNIIKAHRGSQTYMTVGTGRNLVLQEGELFLEYPDAGLSAEGSKLKIGDGVTPYYDLPYITSGSAETKDYIDHTKCMVKNRYLIQANVWSNSVDNNGYYTYDLGLVYPYLSTFYSPNIYVAGADNDTFATPEQKAAYNLLEEAELVHSRYIKFYASTKPDIDFYVYVEGREQTNDEKIIDRYFDPVTRTATEYNFGLFLNSKVYSKAAIGCKVTLANSVDYNGGTWIIADVNHDANQRNSYDLISLEGFGAQAFNTDEVSSYWRDSTIRTWLNETFYDGFNSSFKTHMMNIRYDSNDSSYNDDRIILPSFIEVGFTINDTGYYIPEGTKYPIFTDDASRVRYTFGTTDANRWWTRSRDTETDGIIWAALEDGSFYHGGSNFIYNATAVMRVS